MDIEKEGEALYRQFSLGASDEGMKHVFTWLADQERLIPGAMGSAPRTADRPTVMHLPLDRSWVSVDQPAV